MKDEPAIIIRLEGNGRNYRPGESFSGEYVFEDLVGRSDQGIGSLHSLVHRRQGRRRHGRARVLANGP